MWNVPQHRATTDEMKVNAKSEKRWVVQENAHALKKTRQPVPRVPKTSDKSNRAPSAATIFDARILAGSRAESLHAEARVGSTARILAAPLCCIRHGDRTPSAATILDALLRTRPRAELVQGEASINGAARILAAPLVRGGGCKRRCWRWRRRWSWLRHWRDRTYNADAICLDNVLVEDAVGTATL